jgi:hypothetical protein
MMRLTRFAAVLVILLAPISCAREQVDKGRVAQAQPPTEQQEEFIPIDQLPPQEQLPAAPLLVGAYAFVLLMLFAYLIIVARRLTVIQREVDRLEKDLKRTGTN